MLGLCAVVLVHFDGLIDGQVSVLQGRAEADILSNYNSYPEEFFRTKSISRMREDVW